MWPPHSEAVEQTLAAEQRIEDAYAEALHRWAPAALAAVLPSLDATVITADAAELPPDPEAVTSTQPVWEAAVAATVLPVVAAVWADAATAAAGVDTVGGGIGNIVSALTDTAGDYLVSYGRVAATVPAAIRTELLAVAGQPGQTVTQLRALVRDAVSPGSALLRKTSRRLGYHAGGVLNHALMSVARHAGTAERKTWVSRRDSRVRDTHWVADGQTVPLDGMFTVDGVEIPFPGALTAPLKERAGCRCRISVLAAGEEPRLWRVPAGEAKSRAARGVTREAEPPIAASAGGDTMTAAPQTAAAGSAAEITQDAVPEVTQPPDSQEQTSGEQFRTFTDAAIAFIGTPTSDRRVLAKNINLSYRSMPLPLMWMRHSGDGGHVDAVTVGVIEAAHHQDGEKVVASGYLLNTPEADEAAAQLSHGVTRPSVDLGGVEWMLTDESGNEISEEAWWELSLNARVFHTFTAAELMGITLVQTPAFGDTKLTLNEALEARDPAAALTASAAYTAPVYPAGYFTDPQLKEPTMPMMLDDGRIVGHLVCWGQCHRAIQSACVQAPHSPSGYNHFHTSPPVRLDDGTRIPVGRLTVGTGHADPALSGTPAAAHYDNTGNCFALVRVGEDEHGIWFSGVPAPGATPDIITAGLAAPLSGDWRDFGQGLDLIAALAVNTPGFAARGRDDRDGRPLALVASLGPGPTWITDPALTRDDIKAAVAEALDEQRFAVERDTLLARASIVTRPKTVAEEIDELLARAAGA